MRRAEEDGAVPDGCASDGRAADRSAYLRLRAASRLTHLRTALAGGH
ncbi:hypothetical protein ACFYNW_24645 [Streptomyces virginiae]